MTQLIIAGVETVLPQNFSVTVKRENSFFTKSGEYTYDCNLRLDNPVNQQLYGFLHRLNKSDQVDTRRSALLMADGHVYCRGTEVITKWTDQTVSIQIVSGESELNYFVGQDQKIEDLVLGDIGCSLSSLEGTFDLYREGDWMTQNRTYGLSDFCLPTIKAGDTVLNNILDADEGGEFTNSDGYYFRNATPQPYLCAILRRLLTALNYNRNGEGVNQLEQTLFRNLFLVNTVRTTEYAKMLPGWTVKDFMTEIEKLCGIVFVTDNSDPNNLKCDIYLKTAYYLNARQLPLNDVIDSYEMEVEDDESREAEFTASDVSYDLPDGQSAKLMKLPEGYLSTATVIEHHRLSDLMNEAQDNPKAVHKVEGEDRLYIVTTRDWREPLTIYHDVTCLMEIDQFHNLDRVNNESTLELKITPAPMDILPGIKGEVISLGETNDVNSEDSETSQEVNIEQQIQDFSVSESQAGNIYCAFFNGFYIDAKCPLAYTDAAHAYNLEILYYNLFQKHETGIPEGSLRLQDLDADYYQGGYQIDTAHAVTFQTFDPNHIDVRQVYVVNNKRYVVRDVEETISAEGRQPLWKLTCYPINISDEAIDHRWILTKGVWDDGGAWLDDGRWNDERPEN